MRLITGIDGAMPDVGSGWSNHAEWNQSDVFWPEDFRQIAGMGFDLLRWGMPWSLVEPKAGVYRWDLIDPKVELAAELGMEILFPIVHFNYPQWLAGDGGTHAVLSGHLADHLQIYTEKLLERYRFKFVIPVVEVQMDAYQRGYVGGWQPHQKSRVPYCLIYNNLLKAFKSSAGAAKAYGAKVFCSEPASQVQTVLDLKDSVDVAGIDLYPHMHAEFSILGYFRRWWQVIGLPLCVSEFGIPETYDPPTHVDNYSRFIKAGTDSNRMRMAQMLHEALVQACREGIPVPFGGWYPGTGNIGWGFSLTKNPVGRDCDRAGLVDLSRQPDGQLKRVLCKKLVEEVQRLRKVGILETEALEALPLTVLPAEA